MILSSIHVILILLIPTGLGYLTINSLTFGLFTNGLTSAAFSYLLGLGISSFLMFLLCLLNIKLTLFNVYLSIWILGSILSYIFIKRIPKTDQKNYPNPNGKPTEKNPKKEGIIKFITLIGVLYLTIQTFFIFWYALNLPVFTWDDIFYIASKSKVIYFDQSLENVKYLPWPSYPLFIQLSQDFISLILGRWDDQFIKLIFPLNFLSFLIIFIFFITKFSTIRWGIAGGCLLSSSLFMTLHAWISYSDFFLSSFNCTTIFLIILWAKERQTAYLLLAALFAAIATFIKSEATGYFVIYIILMAGFFWREPKSSQYKQLSKIILFTIPAVVVLISHNAFKIQQHIPLDERTLIEFNLENINRIPSIVNRLIEVLFFNGNWQIIWFLLLLSLLKRINSKISLECKLLFLSLLMFIAFNILIGCFTNHYIYIGGALFQQVLSRLILHFYPLAVALVVLLNYPKINNPNQQHEYKTLNS